MNQLKSIYNIPFKDSYSHPILTCIAIIASDERISFIQSFIRVIHVNYTTNARLQWIKSDGESFNTILKKNWKRTVQHSIIESPSLKLYAHQMHWLTSIHTCSTIPSVMRSFRWWSLPWSLRNGDRHIVKHESGPLAWIYSLLFCQFIFNAGCILLCSNNCHFRGHRSFLY